MTIQILCIKYVYQLHEEELKKKNIPSAVWMRVCKICLTNKIHVFHLGTLSFFENLNNILQRQYNISNISWANT